MVDGFIVLMVLFAVALFVGFGVAVARAFFSKTPTRVSYRLVALWAVCFASAILGCPLVSDFVGSAWAAGLAGALCFVAFGLACLLPRWWEGRDAAAAVAYLQMHRISRADRDGGSSGASKDCGRLSADAAVCDEGSSIGGEADGGASPNESAAASDSPNGSDAVCEPPDSSEGEGRGVEAEGAAASCAVPDPAIVCAMAARSYDLTRREEEVLRLLLDGKSFAAIAGELFISDNTVKTHVRHIYRKMGVNRKEGLSEKVFAAASAEVL